MSEEEISEAIIIQPDVIYQQDKAAIDIQVSTAHAFPRNVKRSVENALSIVTMDKETAETCNYSLPRGGKSITGPSVHLAKILAQTWGNMRVESKVVSVDDKTLTSQAVAFDLENNLAIKVEVKRSIVQNEYFNGKKTGKMVRMNDDMVVVTGNAGNSIAMRNAILAVIPRSIVDKVYKEALNTIVGDVSDKTKLIARRKQVFDRLKDTYNLSEKEVLAAIGKAAIDHITPGDLATLIGYGQSIKDGDSTVDYIFKGVKDAKKEVLPISIDEIEALYKEVLNTIPSTELEGVQRVISTKEENSYAKVLKLLKSLKND